MSERRSKWLSTLRVDFLQFQPTVTRCGPHMMIIISACIVLLIELINDSSAKDFYYPETRVPILQALLYGEDHGDSHLRDRVYNIVKFLL